ncbi:unnamed protein product [Mytilus coruscus]|uniref:Uncharacterized protein n=1 Tax=Mytilus coruscus TaxID=42192 RepID=A0A6J8CIU1_MYTCO|nr:unnamed protein product [Mytilus coruscus]
MVKPSVDLDKLANKIHMVENENSALQVTVQELKYKSELEKANLQSKLELQTPKSESCKQAYEKSIKILETGAESLNEKLRDKEDKLEMLQKSYKELSSVIQAKDEELLLAKQQEDAVMNKEEFKTVTHQRDRTQASQRIEPSKLSSKFTLRKILNAYTFEQTESQLRDVNKPPDVIAFHSLTNEMVENSTEHCVNKMRDIITSTLEKFPLCKIVLSAPTPRADSCSLNSEGQLISALLKNEYVNNEKVFFCDNSNLSFKGKAIQRFLSKDQFHLSSQGVNVLASNIRDAIDEALKLPKRIPAQQRNSDYRNYSHTNTDYRDYYDYGKSNTDYRNYDEPHNNSSRGGYYRGRGRGRKW